MCYRLNGCAMPPSPLPLPLSLNTEYRMELLGLTATLLTGKIVRFPQPFPGPGQELTTYPEPKALTNQCHTSLLLDDMQVQLYIKLRRFLPDRITVRLGKTCAEYKAVRA